jgi:hypothetical protein
MLPAPTTTPRRPAPCLVPQRPPTPSTRLYSPVRAIPTSHHSWLSRTMSWWFPFRDAVACWWRMTSGSSGHATKGSRSHDLERIFKGAPRMAPKLSSTSQLSESSSKYSGTEQRVPTGHRMWVWLDASATPLALGRPLGTSCFCFWLGITETNSATLWP